MNPHDGSLLMLFIVILLVLFRGYYFIHKLWKLPLQHGPRFFLSAEVADGFYQGPGAGWLRRYRAVILTEHLIEAAIVSAIVVSRRLDLAPLWAGGSAVVLLAMLSALTFWTRRKLDIGTSARMKVAVALESRRFGDYLSWRGELLTAAVLVLCWVALAIHGDSRILWECPAQLTYIALALASVQILVIRNPFPLPAERAEEHHAYAEAQRRFSLRGIGIMRCFIVAILAGYTMQHSWKLARTNVWLWWLPIGVALSIWLIQVLVDLRGQDRLVSMGRGLRPMGSWSGPFQSPRLLVKGAVAWAVCYLSGLAMLHLLFKH